MRSAPKGPSSASAAGFQTSRSRRRLSRTAGVGSSSYSYYERTSRDHAPTWSWETTAASLEPYLTFNAVAQAPLVAPTPLLIVHGTTDAALLPELAQAAYDAATGPKELVWIETHNHIELYDQDPYVSEAVEHVLGWLERLR